MPCTITSHAAPESVSTFPLTPIIASVEAPATVHVVSDACLTIRFFRIAAVAEKVFVNPSLRSGSMFDP
jgi:hypothetical protein